MNLWFSAIKVRKLAPPKREDSVLHRWLDEWFSALKFKWRDPSEEEEEYILSRSGNFDDGAFAIHWRDDGSLEIEVRRIDQIDYRNMKPTFVPVHVTFTPADPAARRALVEQHYAWSKENNPKAYRRILRNLDLDGERAGPE